MSVAVVIFRDEQGAQVTTVTVTPTHKCPEMSVYTYTRTIQGSSKQYQTIGPSGLVTKAEIKELFERAEGDAITQ